MNKRNKKTKMTISAFAVDFETYSKSVNTIATTNGFVLAFRQFIRVAGDMKLEDVNVRIIEMFLATKTTEASVWAARNYFSSLASAFNTACRWKLIKSNPFREVRKPKAAEVFPLFFSLQEFTKLLQYVDDRDFKDLCLVAFYTGFRLSEITSLEWDDIDFEQDLIHLRNKCWFTTKTKKERVVPMHSFVLGVLRDRQKSAAENHSLLFNRKGIRLTKDFVSKRFKRYVRKSGVNPRLHFHSLRHSAASHMVQAGVSIYTVQKVMGHATVATTQIYAHLRVDDLREGVNHIPSVSALKIKTPSLVVR